MVEHLSSPVAQCLSLTLLHFLWQGLLLGLAYWMLLAAAGVRSARVRYATSLLTLTLMALCPVVTFAVLYESASEIPIAPRSLDANLEVKLRPGLFLAGQMAGVEGYVESAALGWLAGISAGCRATSC